MSSIVAPMSWHFDFEVADGVATITFNRPEKLGALTFDVYADLRDLLAELPHRGDARVLVITGKGRGFCSGGDVVEIIGALQSMRGRRPARVHAHDRLGGASAARVPDAGDRRRQRDRRRRRSVIALASDLRAAGRVGEVRVPVHQGGPLRRRHGLGVPAAADDRSGRATELLVLGDKVEAERALRDRAGERGRRRGARRPPRRSPGVSPTARRSPTRRPRWCSPASSTRTSEPRSSSTP